MEIFVPNLASLVIYLWEYFIEGVSLRLTRPTFGHRYKHRNWSGRDGMRPPGAYGSHRLREGSLGLGRDPVFTTWHPGGWCPSDPYGTESQTL